MTGNEHIRISKIMKEYNIGLPRIVEFLKTKGFEIEQSPNARLDAEQYALIAKEFKKEQIVKEESKKVAIKVKDITDKEPKSIKDDAPKDIFIKTSVEEMNGRADRKGRRTGRNRTCRTGRETRCSRYGKACSCRTRTETGGNSRSEAGKSSCP